MLAWKRARAKLNDDELPHRLTFNDLRRTFCSLLRNAGVSLEDCADLLGHADITMVRQVYGHASKKTLKSAIAKMPSMSYGTPAISDSTGPSGSVSNNA
jgi:integrase